MEDQIRLAQVLDAMWRRPPARMVMRERYQQHLKEVNQTWYPMALILLGSLVVTLAGD